MTKEKNIKIEVVTRPNVLVNIVGRDMGAVSATKVESVIDFSLPEAKTLLLRARNENKYHPLIGDENKIKSLVLMDNGVVYPSSFRVVTLNDRIREATSELNNIIEKETN